MARQMQISLVRIPHRQGHSIHRVVRPGRHRVWRKLPHPRTHSSWPEREGSQVARQLGSNNRVESWFVRSPSYLGAIPEFVAPVLPCSRPRRRIGLCWEATRAPSQGPRPNGAARCRPLPFGIGTQAQIRSICPVVHVDPSRGHAGSALGIRHFFTQHVPDDRRQLSHHRHAGDGSSPSALDPFEPLP